MTKRTRHAALRDFCNHVAEPTTSPMMHHARMHAACSHRAGIRSYPHQHNMGIHHIQRPNQQETEDMPCSSQPQPPCDHTPAPTTPSCASAHTHAAGDQTADDVRSRQHMRTPHLALMTAVCSVVQSEHLPHAHNSQNPSHRNSTQWINNTRDHPSLVNHMRTTCEPHAHNSPPFILFQAEPYYCAWPHVIARQHALKPDRPTATTLIQPHSPASRVTTHQQA
jgi:hypothetical protein